MKPAHLLIVLLAVIMLAVPVSAEYVVVGGGLVGTGESHPGVSALRYNTTPGTSIQRIEFDMPLGTTVNFTLYYGTAGSMEGYCVYESYLPAAISTSKIKLGDPSNTHTEQFIDAQAAGYALIKHVQWSSYVANRTTTGEEHLGFGLHDPYYGLISSELVFVEVPNLQSNLVNGVYVTSTQPIDVWVFTAETQYLSEIAGKTYVDSLIQFGQNIIEIGNDVKDITFAILYWLKFIFIDNLLLTMVLYFSVTMAYCAMQCAGNIFCFYRKFFRFQKTMMEFLLMAFGRVVDTITGIVNALKPL